MSEKLQWFKFTPSDWMMGKILKCPEITQARFMKLCCLYWNKECNLSYEDAEIEVDEEHLENLIKKKVIKVEDDNIIIEFLKEQDSEILNDKGNRSNSGKIGNLKRWHFAFYTKFINGQLTLDEAITKSKLSPPDTYPITKVRREEERREEERRIDTTYPPAEAEESEIFSPKIQSPRQEKKKEKSSGKKETFDWEKLKLFINEKTGRKFQVINDKVKSSYKARLKEGYKKKDITAAITNAPKTEYHKENNCQYCTPTYFSRSDIIDKYSEVTNDSDRVVASSMKNK